MVAVRDVCKSYTIMHNREQHSTASAAIMSVLRGGAKQDRELFHALSDISFEVKRGEVVGIIGRNGAGKSTLFKVLSRITEPTSGQIDLYGRVGSLLEVGTGFHPELTGRENIFLNGAILGMSRKEIRDKFDEIVAFSEVEKFLDTPVKRYSSGMYVRLAFAVAAHLEPEVLIVDEVLAVGDVAFQKKCLGKMKDVAEHGRTILFVSHNMMAVQSLCSRCIFLKGGKILFDGDIKDAVDLYGETVPLVELPEEPTPFDLSRRLNRHMEDRLLLKKITFYDAKERITNSLPMGSSIKAVIEVEGLDEFPEAVLGVKIMADDGTWLFNFDTAMRQPIRRTGAGTAEREQFLLHIPQMPFVPGTYWFDIEVYNHGTPLDQVIRAGGFRIEPTDIYGSNAALEHGFVYLDAQWERCADDGSADLSRVCA